MRIQFRTAMGVFGGIALLAAVTLQGKVRAITLIFLAGLALKTWIAKLRVDQEGARTRTPQ